MSKIIGVMLLVGIVCFLVGGLALLVTTFAASWKIVVLDIGVGLVVFSAILQAAIGE